MFVSILPWFIECKVQNIRFWFRVRLSMICIFSRIPLSFKWLLYSSFSLKNWKITLWIVVARWWWVVAKITTPKVNESIILTGPSQIIRTTQWKFFSVWIKECFALSRIRRILKSYRTVWYRFLKWTSF